MVSPEMLRRYPAFSGASEDSLRTLAMVSDEAWFGPGETMFEDDEPANHLYIVTRGEVDIRYVLNNGEERTVDTLVAGDIVVWSAMIEPFRTTARGVTRQETEVLLVGAKTLREQCDADKALGYGVMREIAKVTSHRLHGSRVQLATVD